MAKVKTRRPKFMDVTEIDALAKLYGKGVTKADWRQFVLAPALFMAAFAFGLTHFWWVALACGIYGFFYGKQVIMPSAIQRAYELKSLNERNRFLNALTQVLTDENKITLNALATAVPRTSGELHDDLSILQAQLEGADQHQVSEALGEIRTKYERDVLLVQYFEQLEVALLEGREGDIETMKQLKNYHNQMVSQTETFITVKKGHFQIVTIIAGLLGLALVLMNVSFSLELFHQAYARSIIGWVSSALYYLVLVLIMKSFFKRYFDDDIMSIGKYKAIQETVEENVESEDQLHFFLKKTKHVWLEMIGESAREKLLEMNVSDHGMVKWQSKQVLMTLVIILAGVWLLALFHYGGLFVGALVAAVLFYVSGHHQLNQRHLQYRFERQLEFAKFARLLIPYLKLKKNGGSLSHIFEKILPRLNDEKGRLLLIQLMNEMTQAPDRVEAFITFAEKMSKTDKAVLFMNTVYDLRRSGQDLSVIEEMDRVMSEDLMTTMDQIQAYKVAKMEMFGAKLTFTILILIFGVATAFVVHEMSQIDFMSEPIAQPLRWMGGII